MRKKQLITELIIENDNLKRRIRELEDVLCPYNNHDFTIIDQNTYGRTSFDAYATYTTRTLQCKKCKKIVYDNNRYSSFKYDIKE